MIQAKDDDHAMLRRSLDAYRGILEMTQTMSQQLQNGHGNDLDELFEKILKLQEQARITDDTINQRLESLSKDAAFETLLRQRQELFHQLTMANRRIVQDLETNMAALINGMSENRQSQMAMCGYRQNQDRRGELFTNHS